MKHLNILLLLLYAFSLLNCKLQTGTNRGYAKGVANVINRCEEKFEDPKQIAQCNLQFRKKKDEAANIIQYIVFSGLALTVAYITWYSLLGKFHQNHLLSSFYKKHCKLDYRGDSSDYFQSFLKTKRKIVLIYDDVQKYSDIVNISGTHKENNIFSIKIYAADDKGQFRCQGYLSISDNIKIMMTKKYDKKVKHPIDKDLIFQGALQMGQIRGEWFYDRCKGKPRLYGKWRTDKVKSISCLFRN